MAIHVRIAKHNGKPAKYIRAKDGKDAVTLVKAEAERRQYVSA